MKDFFESLGAVYLMQNGAHKDHIGADRLLFVWGGWPFCWGVIFKILIYFGEVHFQLVVLRTWMLILMNFMKVVQSSNKYELKFLFNSH